MTTQAVIQYREAAPGDAKFLVDAFTEGERRCDAGMPCEVETLREAMLLIASCFPEISSVEIYDRRYW